MAYVFETTAPARARSARTGVFAALGRVLKLQRQRHDLRQLTDAQLSDIGISRKEADAEGRRALWDAPDHWHR